MEGALKRGSPSSGVRVAATEATCKASALCLTPLNYLPSPFLDVFKHVRLLPVLVLHTCSFWGRGSMVSPSFFFWMADSLAQIFTLKKTFLNFLFCFKFHFVETIVVYKVLHSWVSDKQRIRANSTTSVHLILPMFLSSAFQTLLSQPPVCQYNRPILSLDC